MRTIRAALELPGIPNSTAMTIQNVSQYIPEDHLFRSTSEDFTGFTEAYLFHVGDHGSASWIRAVRDRESFGRSNALQDRVRNKAAEALWAHFILVQDLLDKSFRRMDDPTDTSLRNSLEQTQQLFQIVTGPREGIVVPGDYRPVYTDQRGRKVILSYLPRRLTTVAPLRPELSDFEAWALLPDASLKRLVERDAIAEKLGKPDVEIVLREWKAQKQGPWMGLGAKWSPSVGCKGQDSKDALMQQLKGLFSRLFSLSGG